MATKAVYKRHRWETGGSPDRCMKCGLIRRVLPSRIRRGRPSTEWTYDHASGATRLAGECDGGDAMTAGGNPIHFGRETLDP